MDDKSMENHSSNFLDRSQENSRDKQELGNVWENPLHTSIHNEPDQEEEYFPNHLLDSPHESFNFDAFGNIWTNQTQTHNAVTNSHSKEMNNPPTQILDRPSPLHLGNRFDNPIDQSHLPLDNLPDDRPQDHPSLLDHSKQRSIHNQSHTNFNPAVDLINHMVDHTNPNPINTNANPFYFPDPPPPYRSPPAPMFR